MRPSQVSEAIEICLSVKQPVFIWGPPGAGKSAVTKQVADKLNRKVIDLRLSQLDSVDLRGFPHLKDDRMHFAVPAFLPTDPESTDILFFDELNTGKPATQAAAYQLVLDRALGEYKLPPNVTIVAAGNRETDQGATYTMAAPLANRFMHLDFEVNFDDWRQWAMKNDIKPEIVNFMNFRPGLLNDFDPDKRAFPTPRSWEFVNKVLDQGATPAVERTMIAGCVGDGAGAEFAAFLKIFRNLPNPDAILLNPKSAVVPEDLATLYALCGALAARASESNFERLIEYCGRMKEEFQVLCVRDSVTRNRDLAHTQAFSDWAVKNASVLI